MFSDFLLQHYLNTRRSQFSKLLPSVWSFESPSSLPETQMNGKRQQELVKTLRKSRFRAELIEKRVIEQVKQ